MQELDYSNHMMIMDSLKEYASPDAKLTTMIRSGEVIRIRRGLYIPRKPHYYSLKTLANMIYGPSYISFEYALSFYNFIPERVSNITSATYRKNKTRIFTTPVGNFHYRCIPTQAYAYEVEILTDNNHPFLIATREKALCDTLSKFSFSDTNELSEFLFDNLRIDETELRQIDTSMIVFLAPFYSTKAIHLLADYVTRM